jgi:hypothetical protein
MYREIENYQPISYEYVGMATDIDEFMKRYDNKGIIPESLKDGKEVLNDLVLQAEDFNKNLWMGDTRMHALELLEQSVTLLMPYLNKFTRTDPRQLFFHGKLIKGIHVFTRKI